MSADDWLDDLAKTLARSRSRRDILRGLGVAFGAAIVAAFSPTSALANPDCVEVCRSAGLTGRKLGECIANCERGIPIPCGTAYCDPATEFCCNESCSICAPIGGACIQLVCGPS